MVPDRQVGMAEVLLSKTGSLPLTYVGTPGIFPTRRDITRTETHTHTCVHVCICNSSPCPILPVRSLVTESLRPLVICCRTSLSITCILQPGVRKGGRILESSHCTPVSQFDCHLEKSVPFHGLWSSNLKMMTSDQASLSILQMRKLRLQEVMLLMRVRAQPR